MNWNTSVTREAVQLFSNCLIARSASAYVCKLHALPQLQGQTLHAEAKVVHASGSC